MASHVFVVSVDVSKHYNKYYMKININITIDGKFGPDL